MADWYISSAAWLAVPQFVPSVAYTVGQFVRQTNGNANFSNLTYSYVFRCTTAGTAGAEPNWTSAPTNASTVTTGGVTFTNVSGQSAYGWAAAAGAMYTLLGPFTRGAAGDRVFLSSDHADFFGGAATLNFASSQSYGVFQVISVNRFGSVPPGPADIQPGATFGMLNPPSNNNLTLEAYCNAYFQGVTISITGSNGGNNILFNDGNGRQSHYLKDCNLVINTTTGGGITTTGWGKVTLDNTPIYFGNSGSIIYNNTQVEWSWINTGNAIRGVAPSVLFTGASNNYPFWVTCRGVDLSAVTGTLCSGTTGSSGGGFKGLFDSCKIAPGVTRLGPGNTSCTNSGDEMELINCHDGTQTINERWTYGGGVTQDRSTYLSSGALDDVSHYSLKLAANSAPDPQTFTLDNFPVDAENITVGLVRATVEVFSPVTLTNSDIRLAVEYQGSSVSPFANMADSGASVLATPVALPSSSNTWTGSIPVAWNPADMSGGITLSNNNLTASQSSGNNGVRANVALGSGKYYFEFAMVVLNGLTTVYGICSASAPLVSGTSAQYAVFITGGSNGVYANGSFQVFLTGSIGPGVIIGVAVDVANQLIWVRLGTNAWNAGGTANPATGVGGYSFSSLSGPPYPFYGPGIGTDSTTVNFGPSFANTPPSGFSAVPTLTPVKQLLQTTFAPQRAGRVRGLIRLGKPNTTVWVDPSYKITPVVLGTNRLLSGWRTGLGSTVVVPGTNQQLISNVGAING